MTLVFAPSVAVTVTTGFTLSLSAMVTVAESGLPREYKVFDAMVTTIVSAPSMMRSSLTVTVTVVDKLPAGMVTPDDGTGEQGS